MSIAQFRVGCHTCEMAAGADVETKAATVKQSGSATLDVAVEKAVDRSFGRGVAPSPDMTMFLQRQIGNAATGKMLTRAHGKKSVAHSGPRACAPISRLVADLSPVTESFAVTAMDPVLLPTEDPGLASIGEDAKAAGAIGVPSTGVGLLDTVTSVADNFVGGLSKQIGEMFGGIGTQVGPMVQAPIRDATASVGRTLESTSAAVQKEIGAVTSPISSTLESARGSVMSSIGTVFRGIRSTARSAAGPLVRSVMKAMHTAGDVTHAIAGEVSAQVNRAVDTLVNLPTTLAEKISKLTKRVADKVSELQVGIQAKIDEIASTVNTVVGRVTDGIGAMLSKVTTFVGGLAQRIPSALASVVGPIVSKLTSAAQKAIEKVRRLVVTLTKRVTEELRRVAKKSVDALARFLKEKLDATVRRVQTVATRLQRGINSAVSGVKAGVKSVKQGISNLVGRVTKPITDAITQKLAKMLGPKIREALRKGVPPQALASLGGIASSVADGVKRAASIVSLEAHDILRGLVRPDGDHFSLGLGVGFEPQYVAGLGVVGSGTVDGVIDYASHEAGLFFTPGLSVGAAAGAEAAEGHKAEVIGSWGTVLSFGANRHNGVRAGYQGAFLNAGLAGEAALGGKISTGSSVYIGAAPAWDAVHDLPDLEPKIPKPEIPKPTPDKKPDIPKPTPDTESIDRILATKTITFDTAKATISPKGVESVNSALDQIAMAHGENDSSTFGVSSVGGASVRWRTPGRSTPNALNQTLSEQRGQVVHALVVSGLQSRNLSSITHASQGGVGSTTARLMGEPTDNNDASYRVTSLLATEHVPGVLGHPGVPTLVGPQNDKGSGGDGNSGGTGGSDPIPSAPEPTPNTPLQLPTSATPQKVPHSSERGYTSDDPNSPSLRPWEKDRGWDHRNKNTEPTVPWRGPWVPDLAHRPTMGWDTSLALGLKAGAGIGGKVSGGASYSFPLGTIGFPASAEVPIRVLSSMVKLGLDVVTASPAGFGRDLLGLFGAFVPQSLVDGVAEFVFPLPSGFTD